MRMRWVLSNKSIEQIVNGVIVSYYDAVILYNIKDYYHNNQLIKFLINSGR